MSRPDYRQSEEYRAARRRYGSSDKAKAARAAQRKTRHRVRMTSDAEYRAKYTQKRAERRKRSGRQRRRSPVAPMRSRALALFGGRCARCWFADHRALQIDHVAGGGRQDTRSRWSRAYYNRVLRSAEAKDGRYQLLCANCNWIKRYEEGSVGGAITAVKPPAETASQLLLSMGEGT